MSGSAAAAVPRVARELLQAELAGSLNPVGKVLKTLEDTAKRCGAKTSPRLVAVSKTHGVEKVQWGYQQGLRHFGENYLQELHDKSNAAKLTCSGIKWHYLGRVARKKMKVLLDCPGLWMVETVSKCSTAQALNRCWGMHDTTPLKVMLQVNTSKEDNKLGCCPLEVGDLVQYLLDECPHLDLCGLMTVGKVGHDPLLGLNPDFAALVQCKDYVSSSFELPRPLELSMGMSADFEHAIEMGSTNVRVGTALFGPRAKPVSKIPPA